MKPLHGWRVPSTKLFQISNPSLLTHSAHWRCAFFAFAYGYGARQTILALRRNGTKRVVYKP